MCVKLESSLLSPPTPPSTAHLAGGDSKSGANLWWKIITVAAAARCPALREGRWCYGSGRVGKRCPRLPPAFAAPPDHPQPPWVSWQWARQLGNHPLLRWQQPASAALPKRIQGWHKLCLVPKKTKQAKLRKAFKKEYLFYYKSGPFCLLLGHLLHLYGLCEFFAKGQVCLKEHIAIM